MSHKIVAGIAILITAVLGLSGCGENTALLESKAGDYVCAMQNHVENTTPLAVGLVEGVVVATGVLTEGDINDGKRVLDRATEHVREPIDTAKAAIQTQVNCQNVVGKAADLVRGLATAVQ